MSSMRESAQSNIQYWLCWSHLNLYVLLQIVNVVPVGLLLCCTGIFPVLLSHPHQWLVCCTQTKLGIIVVVDEAVSCEINWATLGEEVEVCAAFHAFGVCPLPAPSTNSSILLFSLDTICSDSNVRSPHKHLSDSHFSFISTHRLSLVTKLGLVSDPSLLGHPDLRFLLSLGRMVKYLMLSSPG